ncbi:MAG: DUF4249 family protein, partial [Phaeodactylibacter sp.]|nr:DUF4249 family protein [Phaeodactylibacter sp.]
MRKRLLFSGFAVFSLLLVSCENEVDLTAEWKDLPVVYGLVNRQDSTHFIRIERAFQDQDGSAFAAAANADSLYYDNSMVATIENLTTGDLVTLQRVNGEDYGFFREEGDFVVSPNILYRASGADIPMSGGQKIRLTLNRSGNADPVTATTTVIGEITPLGNISVGKDVDFPTDRDVSFRWRNPTEAKIFDLNFHFRYAEENLSNPGEFEMKSVVWKAGKAIEATSSEQTVYK